MGLNARSFSYATTIVLFLSLFIGYYLAVIILEPFFKEYDNMDKQAKNTLHEMNIPVATIKANAQMLQKNITTQKEQKKLDRILSSCNTLMQLYDELDYGLKNSISTIKNEQFDIKDSILKITSEFIDIYKDSSFEIDVGSLLVNSDKFGFEKTIRNLIENALKYSKNKKVVKIILINNLLKIQDSGIGMDSIEILNIYTRYYRANTSNPKGYGIGLDLVKQYCDNNKITIKIESQKNKGTTINLDLTQIVV